jgi:hypothetical protein
MKVLDVCKNYFSGFQEVSDFRKNDNTRNVLAALKVLSYFTIVFPLGFAIAYGVASLYGRVSKKQNLSSHDKNVHDKAQTTLLKKDSPTKDMPPTIEPSNPKEVTQISEITISKPEILKKTDLEMEKVTKNEQDISKGPKSSTDLSIQELIASMSQTKISGIATVLIADVMNRLNIDIEVTDKPMGIVDPGPGNSPGLTFVMAKKYNKESALMKFLLPVCTDTIAKSFASPGDFLEKGIVFDFLNNSKTGLLDQVKDGTLKKQIVSGTRSYSTLSMTLKAKAEKMLMFKIEQYLDGKWSQSSTSTVEGLLEIARMGLL